ncbi:hypothetical protein H5410_052664 [Solanum commersonii]|uniref:Uncharacterized protein n=1 Tax=Solanum commersonii TaxID=4109 RepID=A0A9J5X3P0_SOLCO|nr:hypothetical protein H5410_052664 [Solanum commersonii]
MNFSNSCHEFSIVSHGMQSLRGQTSLNVDTSLFCTTKDCNFPIMFVASTTSDRNSVGTTTATATDNRLPEMSQKSLISFGFEVSYVLLAKMENSFFQQRYIIFIIIMYIMFLYLNWTSNKFRKPTIQNRWFINNKLRIAIACYFRPTIEEMPK